MDLNHFFDDDYLQTVDGKSLILKIFLNICVFYIKHTRSIELEIISIAANGSEVHTHHRVKAVKSNQTINGFEILAHFTVKNHKIIRCQELIHQLNEEQQERDMESRTS